MPENSVVAGDGNVALRIRFTRCAVRSAETNQFRRPWSECVCVCGAGDDVSDGSRALDGTPGQGVAVSTADKATRPRLFVVQGPGTEPSWIILVVCLVLFA